MKKTLAAIDIGSNAIRMVISQLSERGAKHLKKYRVPIRLGADVFEKGKVTGKSLKAAARAFREFSRIAKKANVKYIKAVATSALREASNQQAFVELTARKSGIQVEVIDGVQEASLIHLAVKNCLSLEKKHALLIDVGGGSVELTFSENTLMSATQSFPFGTVRTMQNLKRKNLGEKDIDLIMAEYLEPLTHFLQSHLSGKPLDFAVGTGGNLEALGRLKAPLLQVENKSWITLREIENMIERLSMIPHKQRVEKLNMKPDRADVILPAAALVRTILRQAGVERMLIPYVGLKDGILLSMLDAHDIRLMRGLKSSELSTSVEMPTSVRSLTDFQTQDKRRHFFSSLKKAR